MQAIQAQTQSTVLSKFNHVRGLSPSRNMKPKKITRKRQLRRIAGPNAMVEDSLRNGTQHVIGARTYCGALPQFMHIPANIALGQEARTVKTEKGIPFVRLH